MQVGGRFNCTGAVEMQVGGCFDCTGAVEMQNGGRFDCTGAVEMQVGGRFDCTGAAEIQAGSRFECTGVGEMQVGCVSQQRRQAMKGTSEAGLEADEMLFRLHWRRRNERRHRKSDGIRTVADRKNGCRNICSYPGALSGSDSNVGRSFVCQLRRLRPSCWQFSVDTIVTLVADWLASREGFVLPAGCCQWTR